MMRSSEITTKILFIHHATGLGGAPLNMVNIIRCLDREKFTCHVLLLKESEVADQLMQYGIPYNIAQSFFYKKYYNYFIHSEANYVKWYQVFRFIRLSILWLLSRYYFANKELKKLSFDIVQLNSSVLTDWLKPAKALGKVVINIQEPFRRGHIDFLYGFFRWQYKRFSDKIVAISEDNANRIGLPEITDIVYNFIYPMPKPLEIKPSKANAILYLGGAQQIKGFYTMVDSLEFIDKDIIVIFAGYYEINSSSKNIIKKYLKILIGKNKNYNKFVKKMHESKNCLVIGFTDDTSALFEEASCLVSPFTIPHFSRPIIEAYLHKKPVIATNIEGMAEIVIDGVTGVLVNKDDPKSLADAINKMASDPEKAELLGLNGYNFAISRFTSDNVKKYEKIYDEVLSLRME